MLPSDHLKPQTTGNLQFVTDILQEEPLLFTKKKKTNGRLGLDFFPKDARHSLGERGGKFDK